MILVVWYTTSPRDFPLTEVNKCVERKVRARGAAATPGNTSARRPCTASGAGTARARRGESVRKLDQRSLRGEALTRKYEYLKDNSTRLAHCLRRRAVVAGHLETLRKQLDTEYEHCKMLLSAIDAELDRLGWKEQHDKGETDG